MKNGIPQAGVTKELVKEAQFQYIEDTSDSWVLAEHIPDIDLFFAQVWLRTFVNTLSLSIGRNYKKVISFHTGHNLKFYYAKEDSRQLGEHIVTLIDRNTAFGAKVNDMIVLSADRLSAFIEKLQDTLGELATLTNESLWELFGEYNQLHSEAYIWFWLPPASDNFHGNFTKRLQGYLKTKVRDQEQLNDAFVKLTNPGKKSVVSIEVEDFLKLALLIDADAYHKGLFIENDIEIIKQRMKPAVKMEVLKHYYTYHHVKYNFLGTQGVYDFDYYVRTLSDILRSGVDLRRRLEEETQKPMREQQEKERLFRELRVDDHHQQLFAIFGDFMISKVYRRDIQIKALYVMEKLLREAAHRLGITLSQVRFLLVTELRDALLDGRIDRETLRERERLCAYYAEQGREAVFIGDEARELAKQIKDEFDEHVTELQGQCACQGKATGTIRIINNPAEIPKMKKGDILVSIATNPDLVPAMEKAAAILTDYGGVTSHAAIVSRELGIPCVIGLSTATKVLKDGDLVEVDATRGVVLRLQRKTGSTLE